MTLINRIIPWLAVLLVISYPISMLGAKYQLWNFEAGIETMKYLFFISLGFVFVSALGFVVQLRRRGKKRAMGIALLLSLVIPGVTWNQLHKINTTPEINDISTDTQSPPQFGAQIAELRGKDDNSITYPGQQMAKQQHQAYPDIKSVVSTLAANDIINLFQKIILQNGWELHEVNYQQGIIEATETSSMFGFKDDLVIRVTEDEQNNRRIIDVRSASRVGDGDLGANAERIRELLQEFYNQSMDMSNQPISS